MVSVDPKQMQHRNEADTSRMTISAIWAGGGVSNKEPAGKEEREDVGGWWAGEQMNI